MSEQKIVLIRHGQTEWNKAGRLHGRSDLPMNETGVRQAQQLAQEFAIRGPWAAVYSSPLFRALQTAQIISKGIGTRALYENPELMEQDFGDWEGKLVGHPVDEQRQLHIGSGETEKHLVERAVNALFKICQQHAGDNVLVVSHGALISSVLSALTGESDPQVANGTYRELDARLLNNYVSREPLSH
ncbi:histidine phosphatase family protein [Arthrobacter sp. S41]|uniref:histidine phosphatase family protein n=1 Tax=Arthrobacter sp. S41 TaxID=2509721 RepID=UPI00103656B1|nr:histidine phosphatase family protein [Arthrobacter sp. S41]TAP28350.1 histidine phosphatase family protein [Arthrobacter sp. S41]